MGRGDVRPPDVRVEDRGGVQAVSVRGRLCTMSAADVRRDLHAVLDSGTGVLLVDFDGLEIGDATALGLLVEFRRRAARLDRHLHVVAVDERTRRLLRRIGLDRRAALA